MVLCLRNLSKSWVSFCLEMVLTQGEKNKLLLIMEKMIGLVRGYVNAEWIDSAQNEKQMKTIKHSL